MSLVFFRIYQSINYTFEWTDKGRIISQLLKFGGGLNLSYLDTYYEVTFKWHNHMRDEIYQTISTCDEKTQVFMFEELIPYLSNWRIKSVPINYIENIVQSYNEEEEIRFNKEIAEKDEQHRQTVDYSKPHLTEYEIERKHGLPLFMLNAFTTRKQIVSNNYFYSNGRTPNYIDDSTLPKYYEYLDTIQSSFREKAGFHVRLYQEGKYVPKDRIIIEKNILALDEGDTPKLLGPPEPTQKITVDLTAAQLLYLFKALKDRGIIKNMNLTDIYKAIISCFQLASGQEGKDMSVKHLQNTWSNLEGKPAGFWFNLFIELSNQAKKDNPKKL